jgi:hypothetical protein
VWLGVVWRDPPRLWVKAATGAGDMRTIWSWDLNSIRFERVPSTEPPVLVVPQRGADLRLRGPAAASFLASLLPKVNGADCASASIKNAVARVTEAEAPPSQPSSGPHPGRRRSRHERALEKAAKASDLRAWERLAQHHAGKSLLAVSPEERLALEMAVTEEVEQRALGRAAAAAAEAWSGQEAIAAIADDLLVPDEIRNRIQRDMPTPIPRDPANHDEQQ